MDLDEFLRYLYGKSARNAHIREMAKQAIQIFKENQSIEHQELCKKLGIGMDKYQKPRRTFYFVVNPLIKVDLIQKKRIYITPDRKKYNTIYIFSPERFLGYMKKTVSDFHLLLH